MLAAHHHLSVIYKVHGEQQSADRGIDQRYGFSMEEHGNNSEYHKDNKASQQNATHHGEINLGLQGEDRQSETNSCRNTHSHENLQNKQNRIELRNS